MLAHAVLLMTGLTLAVAASAGVTSMTLTSGATQTAHAMVAVGTKEYETTFTTSLAVRVKPEDAKVRFTCITPGCTFPTQVVVENANRAALNAFDVDADSGVASIKFVVRTPSVEPVTIVAQAANAHGPTVRFLLVER
jgi:hypothetical protein